MNNKSAKDDPLDWVEDETPSAISVWVMLVIIMVCYVVVQFVNDLGEGRFDEQPAKIKQIDGIENSNEGKTTWA